MSARFPFRCPVCYEPALLSPDRASKAAAAMEQTTWQTDAVDDGDFRIQLVKQKGHRLLTVAHLACLTWENLPAMHQATG